MVGYKPIVDLNGFYNYAVNGLIPRSTESGEPELNNIGDKFQDNNELVIHNGIIDARWNKTIGIIEEKESIILVKLDDGTCIRFEPWLFLEDNYIVPLFQRGGEGVEWYNINNIFFPIKFVKLFPHFLQSITLVLHIIHIFTVLKLPLKSPFTITISIYYIIYQIDKYKDTWYQN